MHPTLARFTAALALCLPLTAQLTVVAPSGYSTVEGNSNNAYPWNRGSSSMRAQFIHDSSNFASAPAGPIVIQRLRYRADDYAGTWSGGSWPNVRIDMATATTDYLSANSTFASNLGPDLTTVVNGPVTVSAGTSNGIGVPGPFYIDIPLTTLFLYDPSQGDLVVDIYLDGTGWTGQSAQTDSIGGGALCTRIYDTTGITSPAGTVGTDYGPVVEFSFAPAAGYAYSSAYGSGCIDRAGATFYELFGTNSFDLGNTTLQLVPTGTGYAVLPAPSAWFTPVGATLALTDDSVSPAQPLGFTLNYPGGSTSNVYVSSNGYVWAQSSTNNGCCNGDPAALLTQGARWCALWNDLNPAAGGTVRFDTDPANGAAYVTFDQVREYGTTNPNTFQIAFFSNGTVEYRFQSCTIANHQVLTGWSPGSNNRDPGSIDISGTAVIITQPDLVAITHSASSRPVIGTAFTLETEDVPASGIIGATLFGLTEINPGLDLTSIGMPGCYQYVSIDASAIWVPNSGVGSTLFSIPNVPGLAGVEIKTQGAALVPGINTLGAITSNGLKLNIDVN